MSEGHQLDALTLRREIGRSESIQSNKPQRRCLRSAERAACAYLYLLQDAAGGGEALEVFVNQFCWNLTDLLIRETLDRIHLAAAGSLYYYKCIHIVHIHPHADQTSRWVVALSPTAGQRKQPVWIQHTNERKKNKCVTSKLSSTKKASPDTFSNFLSGKSGWRSGMNSLTLFFLHI